MSIFEKYKIKGISESSINLYMKNILRLNDNQVPKNLNFLKDSDTILKKIENKKPNTRRTYIISVVSLLKGDPKYKKIYDKYYKILIEYNKDLKENTSKSDSQKKNWITQEEVQKIYQNYKEEVAPILKKKKLDEKEYEMLLSFLILSFYTCQQPRRNLDYLYMVIVKKYSDNLPKKYNYLDISQMKFYFNNYKTQKTYKTQIVDINTDLQELIKSFLKYHPLKSDMINKKAIPLLVDYNGLPFDKSNTITRILNKIFDKKIGCSMLRNIFLTSKYGDKNKDLKTDVEAMGTSSNIANTNYIKTDG